MPTDPFFHMKVDDVFNIAGRGTVVTGTIDKGTLHTGDEIVIRGGNQDLTTSVTSIEAFRKVIPDAAQGEAVGVLLKGVRRGEVERGFELISPEAAK